MHCAVVGSPISHSLSPVIHRAAYADLGLNWEYTAHQLDEAALAGFVTGLDADWRGLSVTMPLKRAALEIASAPSDLAETVGAANTLIQQDDGTWFADNTDVPGAIAAMASRGVPRPSAVCMWGGGATAASFLAALAMIEAGPAHVHVRSVGRASSALAVADSLGYAATPVPWKVSDECGSVDLTVSTVPATALEPVVPELTAPGPSSRQSLFDVSYDPWPTAVAQAWSGPVVGGLDLLVHQAIGQVRLFTGSDVAPGVLMTAAIDELEKRRA